jgi:hypothetical protein
MFAEVDGSHVCRVDGLLVAHLLAYFRVLRDSSKLLSAGDMHAIMSVRLLPPSESCLLQCVCAHAYERAPCYVVFMPPILHTQTEHMHGESEQRRGLGV